MKIIVKAASLKRCSGNELHIQNGNGIFVMTSDRINWGEEGLSYKGAKS